MSGRPRRLEPRFLEKVWGATELEPWFPKSSRKIGEVWFPAEDILVKFNFTSERLSIQVHPDDAQARAAGLPNGKTEMWHILRAGDGACVGLGFRHPVTADRIRESALSGEIENLIDWKPAAPGDTFFVPANTVHAVGPALALCEIQQTSDTTYRLYDYGRPRELHLEQAVSVSRGEPHPGKAASRALGGGVRRLAECPYFVTDLVEYDSPAEYPAPAERYHLLVVVGGSGWLDGRPVRPGDCWRLPRGAGPWLIEPGCFLRLVRTYPPG